MNLPQKIASKAHLKARYILTDIGHKLGFYRRFYQKARGCRIMVYHGICRQDHLKLNTLFITRKTFEAHLKFYKKHFNVISLADYYQQKFSADKFNICLTFDDGFANNHKYVLPLLEQYQIPATFFITAIQAAGYDILWNDFLAMAGKYGPSKITVSDTHYVKNRFNKYISTVDGVNLADELRGCGFEKKRQIMKQLYSIIPFKNRKNDEDYWKQMTPAEIGALAASDLVTIGAHSYYHNDLARINITDAAEELVLSKLYLENIIEKNITGFAFPYGSYNHQVIAAAKNAGYQQLLATDFNSPDDKDDPFMRERFTVNPFISVFNQMCATVKGSYE